MRHLTALQKAFLNAMLHKDDSDVTRFLWLSDPTDPCSSLTTYRFRAVLFGATCSPFILSATILKHLTLNKDNPAASTISNDLYVDNVVSSFTSETDVLKYFRQARELMAAGGFNLRSWTSNSSELRAMAEAEGVVDRDAVIKVLGLLWEPEIDQMSFVMRSINSKEKATKRGILQQTSTIYDPLGMLAPVTIRAKLLIQDLWKRKYAWDTPIPEREQNTWLHIAEDLNEAMTTSFPRLYFLDSPPNMVDEDYVLHVFVDASTRAYGAYLNTSSNSAFVFVKNRVAPVNELSLPRLELMAALIGARVAQHNMKAVLCKRVVCWSDSQITLQLIHSTKQLKRFEKNRVEEIRKLISDADWRYCPTVDNRADLQTRGIFASLLNIYRMTHNSQACLAARGTKWMFIP
ncbi:uncharacterized protein LOC127878293 [Dreissena polymorpha]|uniref:uncharacterized protein LOC127878293 n=1 Tax=Dreissena polymorpha TaxID=45954 RepID=UPI00226450A7|nr:uncharacterized protein LOC127878293 [Dreissena polymorpha]